VRCAARSRQIEHAEAVRRRIPRITVVAGPRGAARGKYSSLKIAGPAPLASLDPSRGPRFLDLRPHTLHQTAGRRDGTRVRDRSRARVSRGFSPHSRLRNSRNTPERNDDCRRPTNRVCRADSFDGLAVTFRGRLTSLLSAEYDAVFAALRPQAGR